MSLGATLNRLISERVKINALTGNRMQNPPPPSVMANPNPPKAMGSRAKFGMIFTFDMMLNQAAPDAGWYTIGNACVRDWVRSSSSNSFNAGAKRRFYLQMGSGQFENFEAQASVGQVPPVIINNAHMSNWYRNNVYTSSLVTMSSG